MLKQVWQTSGTHRELLEGVKTEITLVTISVLFGFWRVRFRLEAWLGSILSGFWVNIQWGSITRPVNYVQSTIRLSWKDFSEINLEQILRSSLIHFRAICSSIASSFDPLVKCRSLSTQIISCQESWLVGFWSKLKGVVELQKESWAGSKDFWRASGRFLKQVQLKFKGLL